MGKERKTVSSNASVTRVPGFFKCFFKRESFYKMKLEVQFLDQITSSLRGAIPGTFSLRGPSGKIWKVCLVEVDDGYYFEKGWHDFVIDNYMTIGDVCVFRYVKKLRWCVQIFDKSGCEKESAFEATCSQPSSSSARLKRKVAVKNHAERLGGRFISLRREITNEEKHMAYDAARRFVSRNPYVMIVMRDSYVYTGFSLPIPRKFWKADLPRRSQTMTVKDPRGKTWPVRFYLDMKYQIGQFTKGWRKISFTNNIEAWDVCIFELVEPKKFKLYIFRVIEEITPLRKERDMGTDSTETDSD